MQNSRVLRFSALNILKLKFLKIIPVLLIFGLWSCGRKAEINPPVELLLSRGILGYGVVTASYTRVFNEPSVDGVSLGYVREKTILKVLERRLVKTGDKLEYWVFTEGDYLGWLPESVIKLYENEGKAETAASQ